MTTCLTKSHQMLAVVILLWTCVSTLAVSTSASSSTTPSPTPQATPTDGCCAKCIGKTTDLPYTYDPVVHTQCSAAKGVCCYNCGQDSAAQINIVNADYGDDGVTPQVKAGEWVQVAWPNIARVTYEFYQPNQNKTTTVRNGSSEARISGGYFYICAKTKGYMYVRGWGQDPCLSATTEDKIEVCLCVIVGAWTLICLCARLTFRACRLVCIQIIAGKDSASCGRLPNSDEDESTSGSSSSHAAANTSSEQSGSTQTVTKNDIEETCNTQRASVVVQADGEGKRIEYACLGWRSLVLTDPLLSWVACRHKTVCLCC